MGVRRTRMSWSERNELWRRWRAGESLVDIARALDRERTRVGDMVAAAGGIAPPAQRRSRLALTAQEREEISRGIAQHETVRRLAQRLHRAPSTISREIRRHGGRPTYRAQRADRRAWARARRPKVCRLATRPVLRRLIAEKLTRQWSPQQIAGWLRRAFPSDPDRHVSHETIYRSLFVQSRGVLKRELVQHLRRHRARRQARAARRVGHYPGHIVDAVSIRQRPADATDRAVPAPRRSPPWSNGSPATCCSCVSPRPTRRPWCARSPTVSADCRPDSGGLSPGIAARNSPATAISPSPRMCRCTSAIRKAPGSAARTKTPTAWSDNTCRKERTCPPTRRRSWMRSPFGSTRGRGGH
jgi:hypothetical protein